MARKRNRSGQASGKVDKETQRITDMLEELEAYDEHFTEWETEFYESICKQFYDLGKDLTGPQIGSIERMHNRLCQKQNVFRKDSVKYNC